MKKLLTICFIILTTIALFGQNTKYGALAIDKTNGFYYGWAYDYSSLAEAEKRALQECKNKGGNAEVVLSWSGTGCAVYRTIDGSVGTAYGWGIAPTMAAADAIATNEALKRSGGITPANNVWACNSSGTFDLEIILNDNNINLSNQRLHQADDDGAMYDYIGNVVNNLPHGFGTLTYEKSGSIYKGNFLKGKRSGYGIYIFKSGRRYEGDWKNDNMHGYGKWTDAEGGYYEGEYENGLMHGQGKYVDANGKILFEGRMENDEPVNN
ncbi:MAG: DUF4189 domain-containing protein [Bacteroidetes bacterium]|nr:DUF4189 domain-containing protein [Bacteroidota bacterium]